MSNDSRKLAYLLLCFCICKHNAAHMSFFVVFTYTLLLKIQDEKIAFQTNHDLHLTFNYSSVFSKCFNSDKTPLLN